MTPTTPEQAMFIAGFVSTTPAASNAIYSLASQIEALTKERDALEENHKECVRCLGEALQDRADLAAAAKLALEEIECALSFVESAYRPPVPDRIEIGRMVYIRLHSLASLKETADMLRKVGVQ